MKNQRRCVSRLAIATVFMVGVFGVDAVADQSPGDPATILFIGDMPYPDRNNPGAAESALEQIQEKLRANVGSENGQPSLIIHLGDFQGGQPDCSSPSHFQTKATEVNGIAPEHIPIVYTPGDNDWTDCDRGANGIDELTALKRLKEAFYNNARIEEMSKPLNHQMGVAAFQSQGEISIGESPSKFEENMRWVHKGVLFVTIHLVANENGRKDVRIAGAEDPIASAKGREIAAERWVREAIEIVKDRSDIRAVVIATQADPDRDIKWVCSGKSEVSINGGKDCKKRKARPSVFDNILTAIDQGAESLTASSKRGAVPVLFAHGDTGGAFLCRADNKECMQNKNMEPCKKYTPLPNNILKSSNLWRLNAMGDYQWDAVSIDIDPLNSPPFQAFRYLEPKSEITSCQ